MSQISMVEYKSFLNFVADRVKDLKELDIEIAEGSQFTMSKQFYTYIIDTVPELNKAIDLMTTKYFEDKINQNVYLFIDRFNEFFAFLHEIGHIVTRKLYNGQQLEQGYNYLKSGKYSSKYDYYKAYRNLPIESLADNFAVEFTNKYFYEIVTFFTGIDKEEIDNSINVFNF
jgi:hypothetical protein